MARRTAATLIHRANLENVCDIGQSTHLPTDELMALARQRPKRKRRRFRAASFATANFQLPTPNQLPNRQLPTSNCLLPLRRSGRADKGGLVVGSWSLGS